MNSYQINDYLRKRYTLSKSACAGVSLAIVTPTDRFYEWSLATASDSSFESLYDVLWRQEYYAAWLVPHILNIHPYQRTYMYSRLKPAMLVKELERFGMPVPYGPEACYRLFTELFSMDHYIEVLRSWDFLGNAPLSLDDSTSNVSAIIISPKPHFVPWLDDQLKKQRKRHTSKDIFFREDIFAWITPSLRMLGSEEDVTKYIELLKPHMFTQFFGSFALWPDNHKSPSAFDEWLNYEIRYDAPSYLTVSGLTSQE